MSKRPVDRKEPDTDWLLFGDSDFDNDDEDNDPNEAFLHAMERRSARRSLRARRAARHSLDSIAERRRLRGELEDWDDYRD